MAKNNCGHASTTRYNGEKRRQPGAFSQTSAEKLSCHNDGMFFENSKDHGPQAMDHGR
jgi:hypothetical protein